MNHIKLEMEQKIKDQFLRKKIEEVCGHTKDLITLLGIECILLKTIERVTKDGQPTLSLEFLAKFLIGRSWKYAFTPNTKILLNNEIADFCDRLQYFSQIPVDAPEKDVVDFLEHKNFSKIREFFPNMILDFLIVAEKTFKVPEDEILEKGIFKCNRTKDKKEITSGYVYNNYSEVTLQENINLIECKIKELTAETTSSEKKLDGIEVNTEILKIAKNIITRLVDECRNKAGFQRGVSLIDAEIIPLINKEIDDLKVSENEKLKSELIDLVKTFKSKIQNDSSFVVEISKDDIKCSVKDG